MASTRTARRQLVGDFVRLPGSRKPFRRSIELHQKIIDRLAELASALPTDRQIAMSAIPPYTSRGHGGKHRTKNRLIGAQWSQDRSKYDPRTEDTRRHAKRGPHTAPQDRGYDLAALSAYADGIAAKTKVPLAAA